MSAVEEIILPLSPAAVSLMRRALSQWTPPVRIGVREWAERYRYVSGSTPFPGQWRADPTPYVVGILDAITDPAVREIVCQKSAQIGWTDSVLNNFLGWMVHGNPATTLVVFPKEGTARAFAREKLQPLVESTPALRGRISFKTRADQWHTKLFPGGLLKLVGSNSPANLKSTPAKYVLVEEPDDVAADVRGQGDAIALARNRTKTFADAKILIGGTPDVEGLSQVTTLRETMSDRRYYHMLCPDCGEDHAADEDWWSRVSWQEGGDQHPVWGRARPETAVYTCPHCGSAWDDAKRYQAASREDAWRASQPFRGVAGFYVPELLSRFPDSRLERLVEDHLTAEARLKLGDEEKAKAFRTQRLGLPWSRPQAMPEATILRDRCLAYEPWTAPDGALVVTAGVDVQHDRLAVILRAWGEREESWLTWWGQLVGNARDAASPVWDELTELMERPIEHASGESLRVAAVSVDSSDGWTSDVVYAWVREQRKRGRRTWRAVKGSSQAGREVYAPPRPVDTTRADKASRYGLRVYLVGTDRAKDLTTKRLSLEGDGPGRFHVYDGIGDDYFDQLTAETRTVRAGRSTWGVRTPGRRNEALDCEVYALHAAHSLRLHQWTASRWASERARLKQADPAEAAPEPTPAPRRPAPRRRGGWMSGGAARW